MLRNIDFQQRVANVNTLPFVAALLRVFVLFDFYVLMYGLQATETCYKS